MILHLCNIYENRIYMLFRKMELGSLFLVCFCLVLVCGMPVLKILSLIRVDVIRNVYCNVSRNTFYLLYSKVFFAQIFAVPL